MSKGSILIVEDVHLIRNTLRARLGEEGYEVATAGSVSEALQAVRSQTPGLIILDLTVYDDQDPIASLSDGFAFLTLVRMNYTYKGPAVVIYTATKSPQVEAKAKSLRAVAVIEKTAGFEALLGAIREAFEQQNSGSPTTA